MNKIPHGGGLDAALAQYGGSKESWLDLSTGINPHPYPIGDLQQNVWARLPDSAAQDTLIAAARAYYAVDERSNIVAASGTQSLIQVLPRLLSGQTVFVAEPTYGEHRHVWQNAGRHVQGTTDVFNEQVSGAIVVVVNPNNPDCRVYEADALRTLASKCAYLIVDEAFGDTAPNTSLTEDLPDNVIILKSFGKFFGLAGLRLGFAVCHPKWAEKLEAEIGPWAVSGPAQTLGARALGDRQWISSMRQRLERDSQIMAELFDKKGLSIVGRLPLFLLMRHENANKIHEHLAQHHILVRNFPEYPDWLRFGLCPDADALERLSTCLDGYLHA